MVLIVSPRTCSVAFVVAEEGFQGRSFSFVVGLCTWLCDCQVGQQEVSDQHEAKVAFDAPVP